jgi:hypothetical protein
MVFRVEFLTKYLLNIPEECMLIAFHLPLMSKPRNHKPKQALNIKGSRHRTLSYAMHDLLGVTG